MEDCVFCKIINNQIPANIIYEDGEFLAFLDIKPLNYGHVVVTPKKHVRWINDLPEDTKIWNVAQKIARSIVKNLEVDHVNFMTLGYEIEHAHVHIIPRKSDDDLGKHVDWSKRKEYPEGKMKAIGDKIRHRL